MSETERDPFAVLDRKKATEVRVAVCVDDALSAAVDTARRAYDQAAFEFESEQITAKDLKAAEKAVTAAEEALDAATVVFVFRSIGPNAWDELIAAHPPSKEQVEAAAKRGEWMRFNPITFPPAAIAASCAEPPSLTIERVQGWFADPAWSKADTEALFDAATVVNLTASTVDLGKGSGSTRN